MAYSKLHSSLVNSSLWTEPDNVRILFITLLALCDREGYVYGSKPGLERLANIEAGEDAQFDPWEVLLSPDPHSSDRLRNPENEGRRIEEVSGGFRLLNFPYYRGLRNDDDRREQNRTAQARFKAKAKISQDKPRSAKKSHGNPISEAEADAETEAKKDVGANGSHPTLKFPNGLTDSEWLETLVQDSTYSGIDVKREHGKMLNWCRANQKSPTRRRFTNWLNRADQTTETVKPVVEEGYRINSCGQRLKDLSHPRWADE